eukprot:SAG11_NODE_528_length_8722_cov_5.291198_5_plen_136_part_00
MLDWLDARENDTLDQLVQPFAKTGSSKQKNEKKEESDGEEESDEEDNYDDEPISTRSVRLFKVLNSSLLTQTACLCSSEVPIWHERNPKLAVGQRLSAQLNPLQAQINAEVEHRERRRGALLQCALAHCRQAAYQ